VRTRAIAEAIVQKADVFLAVHNVSEQQNKIMRDLTDEAISKNIEEHQITRQLIGSIRVRYRRVIIALLLI
jgi:hypothetical protein